MSYPDLLTSLSGNKITTKDEWEKFRREECLTLLANYVYGFPPVNTPEEVKYKAEIKNSDFHEMFLKEITLTIRGFSFSVQAYYKKSEKPLPAILYYMHNAQIINYDLSANPNTEVIPIKDIAERGYAVIVFKVPNVYMDDLCQTDYESSLFKVFSPPRKNRAHNEWSAIALWSWCGSKIMDYIETDPVFDKNNIAVAGHSRCGKTALWTGATDQRFSFVVSNSSGCMGAAMLRGKKGEHLDYITTHTDWFCKNLDRYVENEDLLPVDQHMLLACIAPRLLYVASNSLDEWADPEAERLSASLASKVYELYGLKGVVLPDEIQLDTPYHQGKIGYHVSEGKHKIRAHDWEKFLSFWEKERKL